MGSGVTGAGRAGPRWEPPAAPARPLSRGEPGTRAPCACQRGLIPAASLERGSGTRTHSNTHTLYTEAHTHSTLFPHSHTCAHTLVTHTAHSAHNHTLAHTLHAVTHVHTLHSHTQHSLYTQSHTLTHTSAVHAASLSALCPHPPLHGNRGLGVGALSAQPVPGLQLGVRLAVSWPSLHTSTAGFLSWLSF